MAKLAFTAQQMIEALNATQGMVYVAARQLKCDPKTIYNYAKRYKSVQAAIDNKRGEFLDETELALYQAVKEGQGWAIAFALKTLGKHRGYVEKQQVEQTNINADDLNSLTDEQLKRLAAGESLVDILAG